MLREIDQILLIFKVLIIVCLSFQANIYADNLPIKVDCEDKDCCKRVDDVEFNIAQLLTEIEKGKLSPKQVACSYHQIAIEYFGIDDIKSIKFNKKAIAIRSKTNDNLLWMTYRNTAFNHYNIDDYKLAKKYMEMALFAIGDKRSSDSINIYLNLAEYNSELGDFEIALRFINKAISIKADKKEKINAYNLKSRILLDSKDILNVKTAINFADTALALSKKSFDSVNEISALSSIAEAYDFLRRFDESIFFYKKALEIDKDNVFDNAKMLNNVATVQHNQSLYKDSNETLERSLKLYHEYFESNYSYWYSAPYENLADNYTALQQLDTALLYYQKALFNLTNNFRTENILQNPNTKDTDLFIYSNPDMIRVLHLKAKAAFQYYQQNKNQKYLNLATQTYQTSFNFHDQLQKEISTENSRLFQVKNIVPYIENALKVVYEQQQNGQDLSEAAFRFMEKNKATVLLQSMNEEDALQFANLPGGLLEREKELKTALIFYKKQLNDAIEYEDAIQIEQLNNLLFEEKQKYGQLINNLENNYPNYYRLKYEQNQTQIIDVQNYLDDKTVLLEYFVGDSSIYILSIQNNHSKLYQIKKPNNWKQTINNLRQSITDIDRDLPKLFVENSHLLYQWILNEPLCDLQDGITQLLIIPDAELNYVPFEILLTEQPDKNNIQYKKLPYLLKSKSVGYAYSAALLLENKETTTALKTVQYGGYAPQYYNENYSDLPVARQTVQNLSNTLNGKAYLSQDANLPNFLSDEENYNILHLSMHGVLNDKNPLSSYMAFSPTDSYKLFAYDLYNMKINSDLTILHACNTGTGELQKGEGVMSLSRAFTYAGCPSLVVSLWQIPEKATSEITQLFIEQLQNGLPKDVALQRAKLIYLENTSEIDASPAYWAGLVATGNLEVIDFN